MIEVLLSWYSFNTVVVSLVLIGQLSVILGSPWYTAPGSVTCHFFIVKSRVLKRKLTFNVRIIEFPKSVKLWPKLVSKCFSIEQRIAFENGFALNFCGT